MKIDYNRLGRMAKWLTVGLVLGGFAVAALAQEWIVMSRSKDGTTRYEARYGTVEWGSTATTNEPIAVVTTRVVWRDGESITFERNYVRLSDCLTGQGSLVTTDLRGRAEYHTWFVLGGGSVASGIAKALCDAAREGSSGQRF